MPKLSRRHLLAASGSWLAAPAQAANAPPPAAANPIIGAALPLSGDLALIGDECLRGITLAVAAQNAGGGIAGKPVALITADATDQNRAAGAVNGLIGTGHAGLVLGAGASELCYSGSAAAELAQIPYIELTAPADGILGRGFHELLRTGPSTAMIAACAVATVSRLVKTSGGAKIGLLFNTGATGGAIAAAAISAFNAQKIPLCLGIGYAEDTADLRDEVSRLARAGVKLILHAAGSADMLAFYTALQDENFVPQAIIGCGDGFLLRENAYAIGPALEGTLVIGAPFYPAPAAAIASAYEARFGTAPRSPDSLACYAGAKLVFETLNAVNGDATKLLDALRKPDLPAGGLANGWGVRFDHSGQNTSSFVTLQQWRDGNLIAL